jgi:enediyne biosynthesis protein E4
MQSMVLINDRGGGFEPRPLPMEMQWSPIFSFYADDFDHDGTTDILAGGNFYGVIPFEGRYDAMPPTVGWGDGKGNFRCRLPYPDALLISGEIRDLAPIRLNHSKEPSLIIGRNNDSLLFLKY